MPVVTAIVIATGLGLAWTIAGTAPAQTASVPRASLPYPAPARQGPEDGCLECHSTPGESIRFPSGEPLDLYVDLQKYGESAHGDWLDCMDCHQANRRYPHPLPEVTSRREYSQAQYELCKRCHSENYTRTMDSIHQQALADGEPDSPLCTDCHSAHTMKPVRQSRIQVPRTCSGCHDDVYEEFSAGVHAAGLWEENEDVPDCLTCHGVHSIGSATTPSFRQASVDLCAGCHADKEMMDKYELSSNVLKTYLDDFHGKTVGFYQRQTSEIWPDVAVCTDCHGVHDIRAVDDPDSTVIKENLAEVCRKCHEDATSRFPAAWLSHYEPSLKKAPLVFFVKRYYQVLIPLMVAGLALNVALDFWRLSKGR